MKTHPFRIPILAAVLAAVTLADLAALTIEVPIIWPRGSRWFLQMDRAADRLERETSGFLKFEVKEDPILQGVPGVALYSLPLTFRNEREIDYVRERMDDDLKQLLAQNGYVTLGIEGLGMAHIFSREPIRTPEDFKSTSLWVPEGRNTEVLESFGVGQVVPLDILKVKKALANNEVETAITVPSNIILARWHSEISYAADWPLLYLYSPLVIRAENFDRLSASDREKIQTILGEAFAEAGASSREMSEQAWGILRKRDDLQFLSLSAAERQAWEAWAAGVRSQLISSGKIPAGLAAELDQHLSALR